MKISTLFSILLLSLFLFSCSSKVKDPEQTVLARVGSKEITVQDFRINYEFGYTHLRNTLPGEDPKKQILNLMIIEALLSNEGYRMGLQNSEEIKERSAQLTSELLVEKVFTEKVLKNVSVTDDEIQEAIIRSSVNFKLRFYPANSFEGAVYIRRLAQEVGFGQALEMVANSNEMGLISASDFVTPEMTWLDMDPDFLDAISTLKPGELSLPIQVEDHWFIVEVLEVRQNPLSDNDILNKWDRTKRILERNKATAGASTFVSSMMQPLDVRVDATSFRILASILWDWFKYEEPKLSLRYSHDSIRNQPFGRLLDNHWNDVLVFKSNGNWTIGDFIYAYPKSRYPIRLDDVQIFTENLKLNIGLTLRDAEMLKIAQKERLNASDYVKDSHKKWMDKWVFRAYRDILTDSLNITEDEIAHHYSQYSSKFTFRKDEIPELDTIKEWVKADLRQIKEHELIKLDLLRLQNASVISINEAVLDTITTVSDSNKQTFLLFKRSTGSFAYPVVDPNWSPSLVN